MSIGDHHPLSRTRLRVIGEQLANDRKLDILRYAAEYGQFAVADLTEAFEIPHTTAHEYCRELQRAGLLNRIQEKPAVYEAVEFDIHLSLEEIATAVDEEDQTLSYVTAQYGDDIVDEVIRIWDQVEAGEMTYREASASLDMEHSDFLRVASEIELIE